MNYSDPRDAIFQELLKILIADKNALLLTADTGAMIFDQYKKLVPNQFINTGISEQNTIGVAAGLALRDKKVFVFGISNFITLRCFEHIRDDICGMNLPVTIIGVGTGFVYSSDGLTHHVTEDISVMRSLPNMAIWNPSSNNMCGELIHRAYKHNGPSYIRFDKGPFENEINNDFDSGIIQDCSQAKIGLIATGISVKRAIEVKNQLNNCKIIDVYKLKPLNINLLLSMLEGLEAVYTIEEHNIFGGLGSIVAEVIAENNLNIKFKRFAIPDRFSYHNGTREKQCELMGLGVNFIVKEINT